MSEMIERVAMALAPDIGWDNPGQSWMQVARAAARRRARAAIEAMRSPTQPMITAALDEGIGVQSAWRAMIDAALGDIAPSSTAR